LVLKLVAKIQLLARKPRKEKKKRHSPLHEREVKLRNAIAIEAGIKEIREQRTSNIWGGGKKETKMMRVHGSRRFKGGIGLDFAEFFPSFSSLSLSFSFER
jgi:hypothetical protein